MFRLREHGTTVGAEIRGGLVTFLTLSYILFVQPAVLSAVGMPRNDVFVATCVCSALACFLMGILTNYPFALAPAMGHNFFFAFMVCSALGFGFLWPEALLANLIAGAIFLCLSFVGLREAIMQAVPESLKYAIAVGIGLLIAFVGLQYGDIVQNSPAVLVRMGDLANPVVLVVLAGIAVTAVLTTLQFRGAILAGILATAILALVLGRVAYHQPDGLECITEGQFLERAGITRGAVDATVPVPPRAVRVVLAEPRPSESLLGRVVALPHWPHETLGAVFRKPLDLFLGTIRWPTSSSSSSSFSSWICSTRSGRSSASRSARGSWTKRADSRAPAGPFFRMPLERSWARSSARAPLRPTLKVPQG